jgi:cytochrome P450
VETTESARAEGTGDRILLDPADPGFAARAHGVYRRLRDEHPLYRDPLGRFVALSRFEDVRRATLDWERFSSTGKIEARVTKPSLNSLDPPRHGQLRALVAQAFKPARIAELEPEIRRIAVELLDRFADSGACEAVEDFSAQLPSRVMGRLLGLPDELVPVCRALTDASKRRSTPEGGAAAAMRAYEIFAELYAQRRRAPRDDLLSDLLAVQVDGQHLSEDELLAFGWLMLVGGNDTTAGLIGNGIELLARHPAQRAALVETPALIPDAVEEMLRIASPTHTLPRRAACDIELEHGRIPAGSRVNLLWAAANLDEREFPDPERFDIRRRAARHLAFGHGPHFCLGAALARLEARVAFEEFLRRIPEYEIHGEPQRLVSIVFQGFEKLPLSFEPS